MIADFFANPAWEYVFKGVSLLVDWVWLWLPILLLRVFWLVWVPYVQAAFIVKQKPVLLELQLPKELVKSPLAMELVLNGIYQTMGESTLLDRYWKGGVRAWYSLEMASFGGHVRFFIWTWTWIRPLVESQIYSQYPGVEIHEVEDYTAVPDYTGVGSLALWGCEFALTKADPYPIKTYVDYGLDRDPKEEFKIDPITPVIEFLGSVQGHEQVWFQILIRAHKKDAKKKVPLLEKILKFKWFEKTDAWADTAEEEIKKIVEKATLKTEDEKHPSTLNLSKGQQDVIGALERSISKLAFDVGIRAIYLADTTAAPFRVSNIAGLIGAFRQYNSNSLNGFKPRHGTSIDYPWQDWSLKGSKLRKMKRDLFDAYRQRSYFFPPYREKWFVLNTEELATIFHFPGEVATTPTMPRIPSKKVEPPSTLPV